MGLETEGHSCEENYHLITIDTHFSNQKQLQKERMDKV